MEEAKKKDFIEDFPLFIEAGFVAVKQLDETSATRIFNAAQALNPESVAPQIGLGYIALNKLEVKEATKTFEQVLQKEPDNHLAQTFLGICFLLTKQKMKKGQKMIKDAMEKTSDPTIKNLGTISLEWADKDLSKKNKGKAPFFAVSSEKEDLDEEEETPEKE